MNMKKQKQNIILLIIIAIFTAYFGLNTKQKPEIFTQPASQHADINNGVEVDDQQKIMQAYQQQRSDIQVQSQGTIKAILADDNQGSRHQKMILQLENGLTVLIAHNIDLAPRVEALKKGEIIEFFGEYEYSSKGGVIHWTHRDPQGKHANGWLKYQGKIYQ